MEISYFDLVAGVIILFLGLKGILNGFFKEVFGLIGIIGGIFLASRVGDQVGTYLNGLVFNFPTSSAVSALGFIATLAVFWVIMIVIGLVFKKLSSISGLGPVDKILGFFFGASKFFLIASVIAHAAYSVQVIKTNIDANLKNSILFPIMTSTGAFIMKMDPVGISKDINKTIAQGTDAMQEKAQTMVQESVETKMEKIKSEINEKITEVKEN